MLERDVIKYNSKIYEFLKEIFSMRMFIKTYNLNILFLNKYDNLCRSYKTKFLKSNKYFL